MLKKQSETTRRQTENKKRKAKEDRFEKKPSATKEAKDDLLCLELDSLRELKTL